MLIEQMMEVMYQIEQNKDHQIFRCALGLSLKKFYSFNILSYVSVAYKGCTIEDRSYIELIYGIIQYVLLVFPRHLILISKQSYPIGKKSENARRKIGERGGEGIDICSVLTMG